VLASGRRFVVAETINYRRRISVVSVDHMLFKLQNSGKIRSKSGGDVTEVTFVDDCQAAVAVAKAQPPPGEYETDSEDDFSDREGEDFAPITISRTWEANTRPFPPQFVRYAYSSHPS